MSKDIPNLELLIKLLKMTTATNDGEALVAVRKANEQLAKFGSDWETLLRGKVTVFADPFASVQEPPRGRTTPPRPPDPPRPAPPPPPPRPSNRQYNPPPPNPPRPTTPPPQPAPAAKPSRFTNSPRVRQKAGLIIDDIL